MENYECIYNLNNSQRHMGEYFEIKYFKKSYYLFYSYEGTLKLTISDSLNFIEKKPIIVTDNVPGGCFTIINENNNKLYLLVGCHISSKEKTDIEIPDLVWPKETKFRSNYNVNRKDRKNGMYLLESFDGIKWNEISEKPVLHSFMNSTSCKLGEICFDTHPCLIKKNNEYIYFGRLNSSLDERRVFITKSTDLINWSEPKKITIDNEDNGNFKHNYYNFVVFEKNNIFYALTPYFKACGTEQRKSWDACTLLLNSNDLENWTIVNKFKKHEGRYKDRVNSVLLEEGKIKVFFRENCTLCNQSLISYDFTYI
tara:strand:- start:6595 stop:7530 length:936 start_codon:yes stop_codon:yes gene_type:complete